MISSGSESDEDCYGNAARKLQSLKNKIRENDKTASCARIERVLSVDRWSPLVFQTGNSSADDSGLLEDLSPVSFPLPVNTVAATESTPKRVTRLSSKFNKNGESDPPLELPIRRGKKRAADSTPVNAPVAPVAPTASTLAPPSRRGKKRKGAVAPVAPPEALAPPVAPRVATVTPTRGRRGRGARGNRGGRGRRSRGPYRGDLSPTVYSVGNTHEYPDTAENIPLFSKKAPDTSNPDVCIVEDADLSSSLVEYNEELSVKVYWQQTEIVKFNIRQFQKLSQIFDFFSKRESVPPDQLLFTLRGRILWPDDTPDSVQYNIGLFIDGGMVNYSLAHLAKYNSNKENNESSSGIKLKFQCQNVKRPFETSIDMNQKLSLAMVKCAEYFELAYDKLRFLLDGDPLAPTSTPAELDLEDGECIDVKLMQ